MDFSICKSKRLYILSRLTHYSQLGDVQTLAMLCCAFGGKHNNVMRYPSSTPSPTRSIAIDSTVPNVCILVILYLIAKILIIMDKCKISVYTALAKFFV